MIRFIFNFIFFGVLFYAIAHFFPDAFERLVGWAEKIYAFFVDITVAVIDWISELTKPKSAPGSGSNAGFIIEGIVRFFK